MSGLQVSSVEVVAHDGPRLEELLARVVPPADRARQVVSLVPSTQDSFGWVVSVPIYALGGNTNPYRPGDSLPPVEATLEALSWKLDAPFLACPQATLSHADRFCFGWGDAQAYELS